MRENMEASVAYALVHEGGYVNDPRDPGGATNQGVTQRVYDAYRRRKGLPPRSVRGIEAPEVAEIYTQQYWHAVRADDLPSGVDYAVFDYAVNSGPKRAVQDLQRVVGVTPDGIVGQLTLAAVERLDPVSIIEELCARRIAFMKVIKHRKTGKLLWTTFGKGWTRRVMGQRDGTQDDDDGVIDRATKMAVGREPTPPKTPAVGRAEDQPRENIGESKTIRASVTDLGTKAALAGGAVYQLEGYVQAMVVGLIGLSVLMTIWIMRERIAAWRVGWR